MLDFFEIDFLDIDSNKSGDAIAIRYQIDNKIYIHLVDGGFLDTGNKIIEHVNNYYSNPEFIDYVVVTHPDGDHANGLRKILEEFEVGQLWMLRPWLYVDELIDRFSRFRSKDNLARRLKEIYPNIEALEKIAQDNDIAIFEPFQGERIGGFTVIAPTKERYLDLIVESEKTPESSTQSIKSSRKIFMGQVVSFMRSLWGQETFSSQETSAENNMSVIQFARLNDFDILLTGDAGRDALLEAADYAPQIGLELPGVDYFQIPHHGSRRNVSTEVLDRWLGERLHSQPRDDEETFIGIVSAAKEDEDHPRKAVVRAVIHRGAKVISTEGIDVRIGKDAPEREGWVSATPLPYPTEQEK
ncbi:MAG: MBL fold metallo-hydrolase [Cyanobacteria bacterium P01_D01_bin.6]